LQQDFLHVPCLIAFKHSSKNKTHLTDSLFSGFIKVQLINCL
jgi:hypothetical protein